MSDQEPRIVFCSKPFSSSNVRAASACPAFMGSSQAVRTPPGRDRLLTLPPSRMAPAVPGQTVDPGREFVVRHDSRPYPSTLIQPTSPSNDRSTPCLSVPSSILLGAGTD